MGLFFGRRAAIVFSVLRLQQLSRRVRDIDQSLQRSLIDGFGIRQSSGAYGYVSLRQARVNQARVDAATDTVLNAKTRDNVYDHGPG